MDCSILSGTDWEPGSLVSNLSKMILKLYLVGMAISMHARKWAAIVMYSCGTVDGF